MPLGEVSAGLLQNADGEGVLVVLGEGTDDACQPGGPAQAALLAPARLPKLCRARVGRLEQQLLTARHPHCTAGDDGTFLYNTVAQTWSRGTRRPFRGHHIAAEVVANRLFLLGGLKEGGDKVRRRRPALGASCPHRLRLVAAARPAQCTARLRGPPCAAPGARRRSALLTAVRGTREHPQVQIYDLLAGSWTLGADLPFEVGSAASAYLGGLIYLCGGILASTGARAEGPWEQGL